MLLLANQFSGGTTCVRPEVARRLAQALNDDVCPVVRLLGSIGASDLAPMADIAHGVFTGFDLAPGEGLALINSSAFGTGLATLALGDAARLVDAADVAGALALEGFAANLSVLHRAIEHARPDPVLARTLARFRELLDESFLWQEGAARNLQDPLTYRSTAAVQAAAHGALDHALALADDGAQLRPGQSARVRPRGPDPVDLCLRGGGPRGSAGLRADRAGQRAVRGRRARRQASRHAVVRPAYRAAASRRSRSRPEYPCHQRASACIGSRPAGPARLVRGRELRRRRGHRGPGDAAAAVRAPPR